MPCRSPLATAASFSCLACLAALASANISRLLFGLHLSPATRAIRLSSASSPSSAGYSVGPASASLPAVATATAAVGASFGCTPVLGPGSSAALGCSALVVAASLDCLASLAAALAATANLFFLVRPMIFEQYTSSMEQQMRIAAVRLAFCLSSSTSKLHAHHTLRGSNCLAEGKTRLHTLYNPVLGMFADLGRPPRAGLGVGGAASPSRHRTNLRSQAPDHRDSKFIRRLNWCSRQLRRDFSRCWLGSAPAVGCSACRCVGGSGFSLYISQSGAPQTP